MVGLQSGLGTSLGENQGRSMAEPIFKTRRFDVKRRFCKFGKLFSKLFMTVEKPQNFDLDGFGGEIGPRSSRSGLSNNRYARISVRRVANVSSGCSKQGGGIALADQGGPIGP